MISPLPHQSRSFLVNQKVKILIFKGFFNL
jgi:hypothetical protein